MRFKESLSGSIINKVSGPKPIFCAAIQPLFFFLQRLDLFFQLCGACGNVDEIRNINSFLALEPFYCAILRRVTVSHAA